MAVPPFSLMVRIKGAERRSKFRQPFQRLRDSKGRRPLAAPAGAEFPGRAAQTMSFVKVSSSERGQ